jgi:hypothetical protein
MSVRTEPAVDVSLYSLLGFAAADHRPDRATDALIFNLVAQQPRAGNRHINVPRPPIEDGDFSRTALAIRALAAYAPPGRGGVSHLLSTQRADGSWPVRSRALKFQPISTAASRTSTTSGSRRWPPDGPLPPSRLDSRRPSQRPQRDRSTLLGERTLVVYSLP